VKHGVFIEPKNCWPVEKRQMNMVSFKVLKKEVKKLGKQHSHVTMIGDVPLF